MVWSEETILQLKELWDLGHSTAEIGRKLGVSKNAIVGKAHRLELTARPSPIRRDGPERSAEKAPPLRLDGPTLPPLASATTPPVAAMSNIQPIRPLTPSAVTVPPTPPVLPRRQVAPPVRAMLPPVHAQPRRAAPSCCWPIGEPGKKDFRFCDDPSIAGKPYCEEHVRLAYVRIRDRKEDAA